MDLSAIRTKANDVIKKYRYAILILVLGLALMLIPEIGGKKEAAPVAKTSVHEDITQELKKLLTQIRGVGRVELMLTMGSGEQTVYQTDRDETSGRVETVLIIGTDREEQGLIQRVDYPRYRGAVVVCQGADDPAVRLAVVEAVCSITGLSTDKVTVVKMK